MKEVSASIEKNKGGRPIDKKLDDIILDYTRQLSSMSFRELASVSTFLGQQVSASQIRSTWKRYDLNTERKRLKYFHNVDLAEIFRPWTSEERRLIDFVSREYRKLKRKSKK